MPRSFPSDVIVLDTDGLLHARFTRGKTGVRLQQTKSYRLADDTFVPAMVTPQLANEASLADALRRLRVESGKWEKVSLLLPDSWFRINIFDLPSLPAKEQEAFDVVRWSLKRTLPIPPDQLRVTYSALSHEGASVKVLVLSAFEATLAAIEKTFAAAGFEIVLLEPLGLNIWNAITVRETDTNADRLFVHLRDTEFTTAVFRGPLPLFIRSRNLSGERTIDQEIRLSASYLRDSLSVTSFANCWVAGVHGGDIHETLASEFDTPVRTLALKDFIEAAPAGTENLDAELIACTGVFTG
jgi:Tfp pilus assembly PilM family ATPase